MWLTCQRVLSIRRNDLAVVQLREWFDSANLVTERLERMNVLIILLVSYPALACLFLYIISGFILAVSVKNTSSEIASGLNDYKKELWKIGDKYRGLMIEKLLEKAKLLLVKNIDSADFVKQIKEFLAIVQSGKWLYQTAMLNEMTGVLKKVWDFGGNQVKAELVRQGVL